MKIILSVVIICSKAHPSAELVVFLLNVGGISYSCDITCNLL